MKHIFLFMMLVAGQLSAQNYDYLYAGAGDADSVIGYTVQYCTGEVDTISDFPNFGVVLNGKVNYYFTDYRPEKEYRPYTGMDCILWEEYTEWETISGKPVKFPQYHDWQYAFEKEVTQEESIEWMTTANLIKEADGPCGRNKTTTEARICAYCKEHQKRTKTWGYTPKPYLSEYMKILKGN